MQNGGLRTSGIIKKSTDLTPLITVITVVYNGELTLEQTIKSVIEQTYDNIEYIIIDGASSDGTLDIVKKYEDKIDYWQSEPDKGIYDAMNKGIDLANGDWINFMNAGDSFYDLSVIKNIFFKKNYDCDIIYGETNCIFDYGSMIRKNPPNGATLKMPMPFTHQSCFCSSEKLQLYKFDCKYSLAADLNFCYQVLLNNGKFHFVNLIVSNYRYKYQKKRKIVHIFLFYSIRFNTSIISLTTKEDGEQNVLLWNYENGLIFLYDFIENIYFFYLMECSKEQKFLTMTSSLVFTSLLALEICHIK